MSKGKQNEDPKIPDDITTKDRVLWRDGKMIFLPKADQLAREYGFVYAEQLVRHLEAIGKVQG